MKRQETTRTQLIEGSIDCFVQGDLEGVLARMARDVDFRPSGPPDLLPWARRRCGPKEVAQYFVDLLAVVEYESFEPERYFEEGDEVVVLGQTRMRIKATGRSFDTDFLLRFALADGLIVRYRDLWDTAAAIRALGLTKKGTEVSDH